MHYVSQIRRNWPRIKKEMTSQILGLLISLVVPPIVLAVFSFSSALSHKFLSIYSLITTIVIMVLATWLFLLSYKLKYVTMRIKLLDPNINIESDMEFSKGWDDAIKEEKRGG